MNKTSANQGSNATHHVLQKSTTLNRHYVKRPGAFNISTAAEASGSNAAAEAPAARKITVNFDRDTATERREALIAEMNAEHQATVQKHRMKINITQIDNSSDLGQQVAAQAEPAQSEPATIPVVADEPPAPNPYQAALDRHKTMPAPLAMQFTSAQTAKDQAIAGALQSVATKPAAQSANSSRLSKKTKRATHPATNAKKLSKKSKKADKKAQNAMSKALRKQARAKNTGKFILAFATSAACVAVLGYLVHLNMPDISVRVAAMQTGIEATYPNYVPRDYQLTAVTTDKDNRIMIDFSHPDGSNFTITEENSSWDTNALLNNYVKKTYKEDYVIVREQGITIYISNTSSATWLNGGIRYTLDVNTGSLTKTQIKNIVTSL